MSVSLRDSPSLESQQALAPSLLRSLLPDGWDCPRGESGRGIQSDGLYLRSTAIGADGRLVKIRANRSIKLSNLIRIVNITSLGRRLGHDASASSMLQQSSSSEAFLDNATYVYYFEVSVISGDFSIGFDTDHGGEVSSEGGRLGVGPESIALHANGNLWMAGDVLVGWTAPLMRGDTVGCGVAVSGEADARYFFTRNGESLDPPSGSSVAGFYNVLSMIPSMQIGLAPCVAISTSVDTVIQANFGSQTDHPFLWREDRGNWIICHVSAGATFSNGPIRDVRNHRMAGDSAPSVDAFLPAGQVAGHMISGNMQHETEQLYHPAPAEAPGLARRHSELPRLPGLGDLDSDSASFGGDALVYPGRDLDLESHGLMSDKPGERNAGRKLEDLKLLDLKDIRELARELGSATRDSHAHHGALSQFVDVCRSNLELMNEAVQRAATGTDVGHDLGELLAVHELVTDAIEAAEKKRSDMVMESNGSSHSEKQDIFSLLCHLRGQQQKRRDAAWGLLGLTERGTDDERCKQIIASGGTQSLLILFHAGSDCKELMMVSALTVVYLFPALLESDPQAPTGIHMGVIECLRFLVESSGESTDTGISPSEIRTASAFTMTNLWFKVLVTRLESSDIVSASNIIKQAGGSSHDPFAGSYFFSRRRRSLSSHSSKDVDISTLIDAFTALSVAAAQTEALRQETEGSGESSDMNVYFEFALIVESICAAEYARAMAMKEGVIGLLLLWLRSGNIDLERPAANALRNLTLTRDDYTAGWVHSQLLHENALVDIVERLGSVDFGVRLAMAEIISSLTVAPHTRAGIIEARGVKYLVQLLGSADIQEQDEAQLAQAAGNALLRLALGEVAPLGGTPICSARRSQSTSKKESIIDDIIQNGALNTLVSMARAENYGTLRFLSVQLVHVITEECGWHGMRDGRERELCDADVVSALGKILCDDTAFIRSLVENNLASSDTSDLINDSLSNDILAFTRLEPAKNIMNELRHVLRGLSNILLSSTCPDGSLGTASFKDTSSRASMQLISSGGVKSLLWVASMDTCLCAKLEMVIQNAMFCHDIQIDSCQVLSRLCPVLLSPCGQTPRMMKWAPYVLSALVSFLKSHTFGRMPNGNLIDSNPDIFVAVLQGLGFLADDCAPLKTKVIDEFMPVLLELHRHKNRNVSDAAAQVCHALGFDDVDSGLNDLVDKFIFSRSRLVQAMIRDQLRILLKDTWLPALKATKETLRENGSSTHSHGSSNKLGSCFPFLCQDQDTTDTRDKVRQQFIDLYDCHFTPNPRRLQSSTSSTLGRRQIRHTMWRSLSYIDGDDIDSLSEHQYSLRGSTSGNIDGQIIAEHIGRGTSISSTSGDNNFLACHQYPLNGTTQEMEWVMEHCQALYKGTPSSHAPFSPRLQGRLKDSLSIWFPSALIRDQILPLCLFRPNASFNFRVLTMPSGRYFSFRREGQLISEECDTLQTSDQAHFTLSFRNSSFAGEFTESLLKALYICPVIQGISFSNACEGSELLPFLARGIPSSVTHLTFNNALNDGAAMSLAHMFKSVYEDDGDDESSGTMAKGSLLALAIINSPHIDQPIFSTLIESIGGPSSPLQFLQTLDFSGNLLGDIGSANVLSICMCPSSCVSIEHLDLSRNGIGEGNAVKGVLQQFVSSEPKLEVLNMSCNNLVEGGAAFQLAASLGDVLSKLVSIDVSGNDFSDSFLANLGSILSLSLNCQLVNLNVSNNKFSSSSINSFLSKLHSMSKCNDSTHLSFVHFGGNVPPLTSNQEMVLGEILSDNRHQHVSTYLRRHPRASVALESDSVTPISDITGEPKLHQTSPPAEAITALFSAPLAWRDGENVYHPIEMLDFKLEKTLLWKCFTEASRNIDLFFDNATTDRLQAVMTKECKCLHFSGHGHPYSLTFEDGSGGIHWFSVEQLKSLISGGREDGEPPFKFVFVSACHSALAGHTFVNAGVPHVVCCQQESQLMDRGALSFTRAFYFALALGRTLRDSFDIGKHAVLSSATVPNPDEEMQKFMLLPEDGNHDVPIFNAEEVPEWPVPQRNGSPNYSKKDVNSSLPALPQGFLGREIDMYHTLDLVLNRRFVNIVGPVGIGRSSLAAALCHYIDERKSTLFFDEIYFVRSVLVPVTGEASPIITLHDQLVPAEKAIATSSEKGDIDEIIHEIITSLKQTKSLLVFEKIENLDGTIEAQEFHFFLGQIFSKTDDVAVLVTSNKTIGLSPIVTVGESVYNLGPLNLRNTLKFFAFHCPHMHSARERKELIEKFASHTIMNKLGEDDEVSQKIKSILGGGIPSMIFQVAYEMTAEEFKELKCTGEEKSSEESKDG